MRELFQKYKQVIYGLVIAAHIALYYHAYQDHQIHKLAVSNTVRILQEKNVVK